jgi:serine phosphatase RsbU (regulator of sigma subunit)
MSRLIAFECYRRICRGAGVAVFGGTAIFRGTTGLFRAHRPVPAAGAKAGQVTPAEAGPAGRSAVQCGLDALPFVIIAGVAIAAVVYGPEAEVLPLLAVGPAFAAVSGGLRKTLIAGVVALLVCAALAADQVISTWGGYARDSAAVAGVTVAAVIATTVRQRREQELAEVKAIAEVAQQVLLGPVPHQVGSVRLAVRYMSATSRAQIGGDLYAVVNTLDGCRIILGDVQGKGLIAVKTASTVLSAFREVAHDAADLQRIAERIELSLGRQLTAEQFVTALLVQVSPDGSKIQLLSCGHPPPLLVAGGMGAFIEPPDPGLPLGLAHLARFPREVATLAFSPGDQLLLYTDGVSEARDKLGEFFPLSQCRALRSGQDPEDALGRLQQEVLSYVGHALDDDAAMLLIHRDPA